MSEEGQRVDVTCSFRVLFARHVTLVDRFDWTLNGHVLSPSQRINIARPSQADPRTGFWNSTMTFDPVIRSLAGQQLGFFIVKRLGNSHLDA